MNKDRLQKAPAATNLFYKVPKLIDIDELCLSLLCKSSAVNIGDKNSTPPINSRLNLLSYNERTQFYRMRGFAIQFLSRLSTVNYFKHPDGVELYSQWLKDDYHSYLKILRPLLNRHIVLCDRKRNFRKNETSKCYKFSLAPEFRKKFTRVVVDQYDWEKALSNVRSRAYPKDKSQTHDPVLKCQYDMLLNECDFEEPCWESLPMEVSCAVDIAVGLEKLRRGIFDIRQKGKGNRVYHTLVFMPKEGRKFIKHRKYGEFFNVDVSASHLTILSGTNKLDVTELEKLLAVDFYSAICDGKYPRQIIKDQFMLYLYSSNFRTVNGKRRRRDMEIDFCMRQKLPSIHQYVMDLNKAEKKELSYWAMEVEADLMVSKVGGRLLEQGIPFFTVHDCISVPKPFIDCAKEAIENVFKSEANITPKVKVG